MESSERATTAATVFSWNLSEVSTEQHHGGLRWGFKGTGINRAKNYKSLATPVRGPRRHFFNLICQLEKWSGPDGYEFIPISSHAFGVRGRV